MLTVPRGPFRLPHVNDVHPSVSLDSIGRALARIYEDLVAEGVPDHLARFVERFDSPDGSGRAAHRPVALVAEDEELVRELATAVLGELGLEVVKASSAEEALAFMAVRGHEVAFVFADVRTRDGQDSGSLGRIIGLRWPHARILVTSPGPDEGAEPLPQNVRLLVKPWRGADFVTEAERAVADSLELSAET